MYDALFLYTICQIGNRKLRYLKRFTVTNIIRLYHLRFFFLVAEWKNSTQSFHDSPIVQKIPQVRLDLSSKRFFWMAAQIIQQKINFGFMPGSKRVSMERIVFR